jgi:hypothetical protein
LLEVVREEKRAHFPRDIGNKSQGNNYVRVLIYLSIVGGCIVLIRTVCTTSERGTKIEARSGTFFEDVEGFFLFMLGHID